jgi:hypothetical protein
MRKTEAKIDPRELASASEDLGQRHAEIIRVFEEMKAYRRSARPITFEEILAARDEGRK